MIITGSHPEYCTASMLRALREYMDRGGNVMYLGGNGFYWVTSVGRDHPHVIEVRRGNAGSRNWSSAPGECYHSTTGEFGGILSGAAGDEIDRVEPLLGSPASTLLLASSFGHNESYELCIEEMTQTVPGHDGMTNPLVRAGMAYVSGTRGSGAVFSVGSMNWVGSLGFNADDNNVSRITENASLRFP